MHVIFIRQHKKKALLLMAVLVLGIAALLLIPPRLQQRQPDQSIENAYFSITYPASFQLSKKDFGGNDILYHMDFQSQSGNPHGFVQVWNLPGDLKGFLDHSKASSLQKFSDFRSTPVRVQGLDGYLWDYSITNQEGQKIKAMEVFLKNGDKMYRISYFIPEAQWNETAQQQFLNMVNSLKLKVRSIPLP